MFYIYLKGMSLIGQHAGKAMMLRNFPNFKVKRSAKRLNKTQKKQIKRLIAGQEEKKFTYVLNAQSPPNSGVIGAMINISQGDTVSTREGDTIKIKKLDLRYNVICADATNQLRFIILQWHEDNALDAPTVATILNTASAQGANEPYLQSDQRLKYKVLFDKTHYLTLAGNACEGGHVILRNIANVQFNTASATQGKNMLYFIAISDSSAVTHPQTNFDSYIQFTD